MADTVSFARYVLLGVCAVVILAFALILWAANAPIPGGTGDPGATVQWLFKISDARVGARG